MYKFKLYQIVDVTLFRHINPNADVKLRGKIIKREYNDRNEQYNVEITHHSTGTKMNRPVILKGITPQELD